MKDTSIGTTKSVCPVCLKVIEANKVAKSLECDGTLIHSIFMEKTCIEHGDFSTLIWEGDAQSYEAWNRKESLQQVKFQQPATDKGCPFDCGLCPEHRQQTCCVLLELTNQCNLRCPVCFASAGETIKQEPALSEIGVLYDTLMAQGGPFNIQLSGGEPTLREDLCEIISLGKDKGFTFFQLNTNGLRLAEDAALAGKLKRAGLNCVFLQFDGITERPYEVLRGKALLSSKMKAIDNCAKAGLGVVLVPTLAPNVNDDEIGGILQLALDYMPAVRGVHFQPISYFGRCGLGAPVHRLTIPGVLAKIEEQTNSVMRICDFQGGGAEHAHCSFHGNFMKMSDGSIKAIKSNKECCNSTSLKSGEFVARHWSGIEDDYNGAVPQKPLNCCESRTSTYSAFSLDDFLNRIERYTLAVSGMVFQDAYNLDLERLKRCYICEITTDGRQIPFCAYNLTSVSGKSLYRFQNGKESL